MGRWRLGRAFCGLAFAMLALAACPARAAEPDGGPPGFFDPVVTTTPGITREVDVLFQHIRGSDGQLTQLSARLQYPVLSWLQFILEVPGVLGEPDAGATRGGVGDVLVGGQALVWVPRDWPAEVDVGIEVTLPTGSSKVLAGSTAVRPFAVAGTKLGPIDLIGSLSYQWVVGGPFARTELFQATLAVGYPFAQVAPFIELTLLKPVRGTDDLRPQVAVVPGIEVFLPWSMTFSAGVEIALGPGRLFDQRVLGFLKLPF
jgi:hypothetical protein